MIKNSVLKAGAGALAAAALGVGLAACGGSSTTKSADAAPGIQTVPGGGLTQAAVTTTTATTAVTTPTSGPLSKEPVATKSSAPAPAKLVKKVLVQGTGTAAASGDDLTVNYYGYNYATGKPFSGGSSWTSTTKSTPYAVQIGVGEVIKGWDEGLVGVSAGSRVELIIPPSLAYGADKTSPLTKDTLVFIIDVLKVGPAPAPSASSSGASGSAG
jgi:peptidylprolyl isomerase